MGGDTSGEYSDNVTVSAVLTDDNGAPLPGKEIAFSLGDQTANATTDFSGEAWAVIKLDQPAGPKDLSADFAGDDDHHASQAQASFEVSKETLAIEYQGDLVSQRNQTAKLTAKLLESDASVGDLQGKEVLFTIGDGFASQTVSAVADSDGLVTTNAAITLPAGMYKISASFAGDDYYQNVATEPSSYVVWEPIAGLSAIGVGGFTEEGTGTTGFAFNIKYTNGATYPVGKFEYHRVVKSASGSEKVTALKSTSVNWLITLGSVAVFEGEATFDQESVAHNFRVIAYDGGKPSAGADKFELYVDGVIYASGNLTKGDVIIK